MESKIFCWLTWKGIYGCQPKNRGGPPKVIHLFIGFFMKFSPSILGGQIPVFLVKHPHQNPINFKISLEQRKLHSTTSVFWTHRNRRFFCPHKKKRRVEVKLQRCDCPSLGRKNRWHPKSSNGRSGAGTQFEEQLETCSLDEIFTGGKGITWILAIGSVD